MTPLIVVDEHVVVRSIAGPIERVPTSPLGLTATGHWRILQRIHQPGPGRLSRLLHHLSDGGRAALRSPDQRAVTVIDPRPLLDRAAEVAAAHGGASLFVAESIAAALAHGRALWFGHPRNVTARTRTIADDLGIAIHVV